MDSLPGRIGGKNRGTGCASEELVRERVKFLLGISLVDGHDSVRIHEKHSHFQTDARKAPDRENYEQSSSISSVGNFRSYLHPLRLQRAGPAPDKFCERSFLPAYVQSPLGCGPTAALPQAIG